MGRKISPVTERRRARRAARETCKAEGKRVKVWVPAERKRVAGLIVQLRAAGQQQVAQLRAQTNELVKAERDQLGKRIKDARAAARLGRCVDLTAGPQIAFHAYPKKPPHLKRGGQQRLFSTAPLHGGGKLGSPFRVRGELIANEKAAHAAVLRHLKHDQGGIVVLEVADGRGGYVDGPYFGLEGEGKAAKLRELDPLDPHGHTMGRAAKHPRFKSGLRSVLPSARPRSSSKKRKPLKGTAGVRARKPKGKLRAKPKPAAKKKSAQAGSRLAAAKAALIGQAIAATVEDKRGVHTEGGWLQFVITNVTAESVIAAPPSSIPGAGLMTDRKLSFRLDTGKTRPNHNNVWWVMRPTSLELVTRTIAAVSPSSPKRTSTRPPSPRPQYAGAGPTTAARPRMLPSSSGPAKRSSRPPAPKWPTVPGAELVRICYGTQRREKGFVAIVDHEGQTSTVDGRPADRDVALARAKAAAEDAASRYSGDYDVRVEPMLSGRSSAPERPAKVPPLTAQEKQTLDLVGRTIRQRDGKTDNYNVAHARIMNQRNAVKPLSKWLALDDYDLAAALALQGPDALQGARDAIATEMKWEAQRQPPPKPRKR